MGVAAEDIADGNQKAVLALMWVLVTHFQLAPQVITQPGCVTPPFAPVLYFSTACCYQKPHRDESKRKKTALEGLLDWLVEYLQVTEVKQSCV